MYYAMLILIGLTALLLIRGLVALIQDPPLPEKGQVKLFKLLPIIGVPCGALFLIPTCITLFTGESPWLSAGFLAFSWLGCSLIVGYLNCTITYSDDTFTVRNFLGFKRTYSYQDIDKIRHTPNHDWLYIGRRRVLVDALAINGDRFLDIARKRYRTSHGGNPIPTASKPKWDLFKGNVRNPGEFIFGFILIYVILIAVSVMLLLYSRPQSPEKLEYFTIRPIYYEIDGGKLQLYVPGYDTHFRISPYEKLLSKPQDFLNHYINGDALTVGTKYYGKADESFYDILSMTDEDGTELISLEDYNRHVQSNIRIIWYMFLGLIGLWTLVVVLTITVGRNPEKFSPRFVYLFIKPTHIDIPKSNRRHTR